MKKEILFGIVLASMFLVAGCTNRGETMYYCGEMSAIDARAIALQSDCLNYGILESNMSCNNNTMTWWIDMNPYEEMEGCNPACVVDVEEGTAEVNWRCTGLIT